MTKPKKRSAAATSNLGESPWKDFFEALDMFDPAFPFERDQPKQQQVRKSFDVLFPRAKSGKK